MYQFGKTSTIHYIITSLQLPCRNIHSSKKGMDQIRKNNRSRVHQSRTISLQYENTMLAKDYG